MPTSAFGGMNGGIQGQASRKDAIREARFQRRDSRDIRAHPPGLHSPWLRSPTIFEPRFRVLKRGQLDSSAGRSSTAAF